MDKQELKERLKNLSLPDYIIVTSQSAIKINAVKKFLAEFFPDKDLNVISVKAASGVNEQPVGEETELGAKNRIIDAEKILKERSDNLPALFISIENGIFKNKNGEYEDRAVAVIKFSSGEAYSSISSLRVLFPNESVEETLRKEGGFKDNTVGTTLAETLAAKGIKIDKQDPQSFLTDNRITREVQIIEALEKAFEKAVENN